MRFKVVEINVKSALSKSGLPDLDYALNPYVGCAHGCLYCYAKEYTRVPEVIQNWGYIVYVKKNLLEVLSREVKRLRKGVVGLGTITDGYQPVEAVYKISRGALEILLTNGFRVSIQTKSSLVLRDLDILKRFSNRVDVGFTITFTHPESHMRELEPFSSPPNARIEALKRIAREGIKTWIFYGPIIPGINDHMNEIEEVLQIASETNSIVYFDKLRVKRFMYADPKLMEIARRSLDYNWRALMERVFELCRRYNVVCKHGFEPAEEKKESRTLDEYIS